MIAHLISLIVVAAGAPVGAETLAIRIDGQRFLPYQPIHLAIRYQGRENVEVDPAFGDLVVEVRDAAGVTRVFSPLVSVTSGREPPRDGVVRGAAVTKISNDGTQWLFERPGRHRVRARLRSGLRSNDVWVQIEAPRAPEDVALVARIARTPEFLAFDYFDGGDRLTRALTLAQEGATSRSSYRRTMRDLLFRNFAQTSVNAAGEVRPADADRAFAFYRPEDTDSTLHLAKIKTVWLLRRLDLMAGTDRFTSLVRAETRRLRRAAADPELLSRVPLAAALF